MGRQPFKAEKRRKELARIKKQELKQQRREERKLAHQLNPDGTEVPDALVGEYLGTGAAEPAAEPETPDETPSEDS